MVCVDCGTTLDVRPYGLCPRCFARYVANVCKTHDVPLRNSSGDAVIAAALDAQLRTAS